MNFFEHQEQSRSRTTWLVVMFVLAVIAVVIAVDLAILLAFGLGSGQGRMGPVNLMSAISLNWPLLVAGALGTLAVIGVGSLYRTASLSSGGGSVAQGLGGTLLEPEPKDPAKRRLRNVVEEMALASGVPVPEIYVMEKEEGINAFAAGFTTGDAAVAVTRGTLDSLNREELQGVIAHEFSHILNGDMRLNMRLTGLLFGIMVLSIIGQRVLNGMRFSSGRSGNRKGGNPVVLIALALAVVGYVGLFFGRWIKAGISRQREYLADASAVEFTRHPQGIAGALKKIAIHAPGSRLEANAEEIAHMLFGEALSSRLFATHPPLVKRIGRIEPDFNPASLEDFARELQAEAVAAAEASRKAAEQARESASAAKAKPGFFDVDGFINDIGRPHWEQMMAAAVLAASLPPDLTLSARSSEWAPELLIRILLDDEHEVRQRQLMAVTRHLGPQSEAQVRYLIKAAPELPREQRLPLLEIAFPALKRRPRPYISRFLECAKDVINADGRTDVFEYLLTKVVSVYLEDALAPAKRPAEAMGLELEAVSQEVAVVLDILSSHGRGDRTSSAAAFSRGWAETGLEEQPPSVEMSQESPWAGRLDTALSRLDQLAPKQKERLLRALVATILEDDKVVASEVELLRAVCAAIHVPLPLGSA